MVTLKALIEHLGRPANNLLQSAPFSGWPYQRNIDEDLTEILHDYTFASHGCDVVSDQLDNVQTIFLYNDESRTFDGDLQDFPFSLTRREVLERLGSPQLSGVSHTDPILGEFGPWDRFSWAPCSIHIEYAEDSRPKRITIMRSDVVP